MAETKRNVGFGVTVTDWGAPEYLDGALMQFMVTVESEGVIGNCLAYFGSREDANLFAEVKAQQIHGKAAP
jgi:hypothetical protein